MTTARRIESDILFFFSFATKMSRPIWAWPQGENQGGVAFSGFLFAFLFLPNPRSICPPSFLIKGPYAGSCTLVGALEPGAGRNKKEA